MLLLLTGSTLTKALLVQTIQIRIRELEDDILLRLTESSGDVTEDRALVEGLEESKKLSKGITQKLAEMKVCHLCPCSGTVKCSSRVSRLHRRVLAQLLCFVSKHYYGQRDL